MNIQALKKIKNQLVPALILSCAACHHDSIQTPSQSQIVIDTSLGRQTISFLVDDKKIPAILYLPQNITYPIPAMVILHGSGGLWKNDVVGGDLTPHFDVWADSLAKIGIASIFVDSYSPRGIVEFHEVPPPDNAVVSAEYVRPKDAYAAMQVLKKISDKNQKSLIIPNKIGLMGFSHGGTTTISSLADANKMTTHTNWTELNNGVSYSCPSPVNHSKFGDFSFGIAYYPGTAMYHYYGNIEDETCIYINYAPLLILAGGLDPLYTNGEPDFLVRQTRANGASSNSNNEIELQAFPNAAHSFDEALSGSGFDACLSARKIAIKYIKKKFGI